MGSLRSLSRPPVRSRRPADQSVAARVHPTKFIVILERVPICMGTAFDLKHIAVLPMTEDNWTYAIQHVANAKQQDKFWLCIKIMAESEGIAALKAPTIAKKYYELRDEYRTLSKLPWHRRVFNKQRKARMKQIEEAFSHTPSEDLLRV